MEIKVRPQRRRYLNRMVQSGQFRSESDVVDFALRRLKQDSRDAAWLKRELEKGLSSGDSGGDSEWDVSEEKSRLLRRAARHR